jgi:Flp pilus assembly protein TadG
MSTNRGTAALAVDVPERVPSSKGCSLFSRFGRDEGGNVAIIFALTTTFMFAIVGGAVDYGRWLSARNQTQAAIDSALLAAGRTAQTSHGDATKAVLSATSYYNQMKSNITVNDTVSFIATNSATSFEARGTAYVQTPFLNIIGIDKLPVLQLGSVKQAETTIAVGGNSGTNIEVSMMLDTTGSMSGQKLIDMKNAAKDLIDIVVWADQSQYTSRVALAPFSAVVNVGDYFQPVTNQNPTPASHYVYPASCYNNNGTLKNSCKNQSQYLVVDNIAKAKCVTERLGVDELTDRAPGSNSWITTYNDALAYNYSNVTTLVAAGVTNKTSWDTLAETQTTTCPEKSVIVPLTNNKTTLKAAIDGFIAENATAGAIGHAWAWYLLSPDWQSIWPSNSRPESYSKMAEVGEYGQPKLRKIAVLMTDGAYNTTGGQQYNDNSAPTDAIRTRALGLCNGMKAKGVTVYTVGFAVGNDAKAVSLLSACASSTSQFYNAANGDALRAAFRDIALQIAKLHIVH